MKLYFEIEIKIYTELAGWARAGESLISITQCGVKCKSPSGLVGITNIGTFPSDFKEKTVLYYSFLAIRLESCFLLHFIICL